MIGDQAPPLPRRSASTWQVYQFANSVYGCWLNNHAHFHILKRFLLTLRKKSFIKDKSDWETATHLRTTPTSRVGGQECQIILGCHLGRERKKYKGRLIEGKKKYLRLTLIALVEEDVTMDVERLWRSDFTNKVILWYSLFHSPPSLVRRVEFGGGGPVP